MIAAGLAVMTSTGLRSVSLRSVSLRLGVDPKALYTYVVSKDDLLAGMFDAAVASIDLPRVDDTRPPEAQLLAMFRSVRAHLIANLDLFDLARPAGVMGGDSAAATRIVALLLSLVPDEAEAAQLHSRLLQVTIGSAYETANSRPVASAIDASLAHRDAPTEVASFFRAWSRLDRNAGFDALIQCILQAATARVREP